MAYRPQPAPAPRAAPAGWIDSHTHLWDLRRRPQPWIDPGWGCGERYALADLEGALDSAIFGSAIVVQSTQGLAETREFLALAHHSDRVAGVVGWVDLTGDVAAQLDAIGSPEDRGPLVGVRHPAEHEPDPSWLASTAVVRAIDELGRQGLAYDLLVRPRNFEAVRALAEQAPETRLVLDHCGKPPMNGRLTAWARGLRRLGGYGSVACKISGLVTEVEGRRWTVEDLRPIVETVLEVFGPGRTMFGGDWPLCLIAAQHEEVVGAVLELLDPLSDDERERVFRGTAVEWYGLEGRPDLT